MVLIPGRRRGAKPVEEKSSTPPRVPRAPWPLAAALAGVGTALVGLLPPIVLATMGWVQAPELGFFSVLQLALRGWLLAHGAGADIGAMRITMPPLGVTAVALLTGSLLAAQAARTARAEANIELSQRERRQLTLQVAGVFTAAYLVCVLLAAGLADTANQTGHAILGALAVGLLAGLNGAGRTLDWHPTSRWPLWARAIPRAVLAALAVMATTGAVVAMVALLMHRDQVAALHAALDPGTSGGVILLLVQLAFLPNLMIWCASWALGAGLSIGTGTVISPATTMSGMLPAIPVLGAVPPSGPGPVASLAWLLSGVLAGAVAALVVTRGRRDTPAGRSARLDEHVLVGGLAGVLAGLACVFFGWLSNGDLGEQRLVGVGARLVPLAVMAPTMMGLAGLLTGLVLGLLGRRKGVEGAAVDGASDERTVVIEPRG